MNSVISAQNLDSLKVSGQHQEASIAQVITHLDQNYPIDFYYKAQWLPNQTTSFNYQDQPLSEVLTELLANTGLGFVYFDDFAIILAKKEAIGQQYSAEYFTTKYQKPSVNINPSLNEKPILIGDANQLSTNGKAMVKGQIKAENSPIVGALIYIEELQQNTVTDLNGDFELSLPLGTHTIEVQSIGYADYRQTIQVFSNGEIAIDLQEEVYELGEIVVAGTAAANNVQSAQIGVARLSPTDIRQLPSFMGEADVVKSLLTLPGVSTAGEGASGFNVRGGNIDQNLITQDGALVFNSSHVLGFFSIFNADVIKGVTLYKGNIPAQYGGRLSSVLDVQLKEADYNDFKLSGGIGLVASRATAEIPLIKGSTSLLIGGRSSYSDWLMRQAKNIDIQNSSAYFYDVNAKISHRLNSKGSNLALSYYRSFDFFRFSDQYGYDWGTQLASFRWNHIIRSDISTSLNITYSQLDNSFFDPDGFDSFTLENGLTHIKAKQNFFLTALDGHEIHVGAEWGRYTGSPEKLSARGPISGIEGLTIDKDTGQELAVYLNDEWTINDRLSLSAGLRYVWYQNIGPENLYLYENPEELLVEETTEIQTFIDNETIQAYNGLEPRVSLKVGLSEGKSIKMSFNRLAQYIHLISNTSAATPVDIWQVSTPYIPPQISNNFSIGYFQNFANNNWESSLEVFYKDLEQLVEYKDLPELLLNPQLETALLIGEGRAYGTELTIKKKIGRWTCQLGYTYSRSERKVAGNKASTTINDGAWFPSNFDSPSNLNLNFKYQINRRHLFAANFTYREGRPITAPVAGYVIGSTEVPHFSPRNLFRIPHYHRLDLAYTINRNAIRKKRYDGSLTFSIYNIYFRKNAFSVFFKNTPGVFARAFRLAVLGTAFPAVTYNIEF